MLPTSPFSRALLLLCGGFLFSGGHLTAAPSGSQVQVLPSYHHDVSAPLRQLVVASHIEREPEHEAAANPRIPNNHVDTADAALEKGSILRLLTPKIPDPILSFDGIVFPGVGCNCAPPDTNGAVGLTQFVQMVNEGYQVFDKTTGNTVLGPASISSLWSGFGGACQSGGAGDPVVLYDQLANRWVISQFASATGNAPITDECVAVSTTSDATGTYNRYAFHLGSNFYDYPHLSVWPDAYYMSMNVFNAAGTSYLGPQPFALDRTAMLAGNPATFISPVGPLGASSPPFLPADLDGKTLPPALAPNSFVGFPSSNFYTVYHFHVDFAVPANSTFAVFATPAAAGYTALCPTSTGCVPQAGVTSSDKLDGIGDRLMFRLAYRNFAGQESLVGNFSVKSGGVAGLRWFEFRGVTAGPVTVFQESTYQPDDTSRWLGSAAMDGHGNLAIGFSASSATLSPQIRYAARLRGDPLNTLAQGEAHLFDGTGSQTSSGNRWGDYSALTVDPVDDATFWFTTEYYSATTSFNWRTRIGSFKLPVVIATPTPTPTPSGSPSPTPSVTPMPTVSPTPTPTPEPTTTPTPTPTTLANISTRLLVGTDSNVGIGGFIVTGTQPKKIIVRAIGPSIPLSGTLADPMLVLYGPGGVQMASNDNWRSSQRREIMATGLAPSVNMESALIATLPASPNGVAYTAVVSGSHGGTGIGAVEIYDLDPGVDSKLANISTRGQVQTGDNVLIGGLIVRGTDTQKVIVRALGPSLGQAGVAGALPDPTLELYDGNGARLATNDNWRDTQQAEIAATGLEPSDRVEAAIVATLPASSSGVRYTAIVRGANGSSGIALVEAYALAP
ncbi:MAG: hypothetical protein ACR2G0_01425 [Chthoniobacterales bacterium]